MTIYSPNRPEKQSLSHLLPQCLLKSLLNKCCNTTLLCFWIKFVVFLSNLRYFECEFSKHIHSMNYVVLLHLFWFSRNFLFPLYSFKKSFLSWICFSFTWPWYSPKVTEYVTDAVSWSENYRMTPQWGNNIAYYLVLVLWYYMVYIVI